MANSSETREAQMQLALDACCRVLLLNFSAIAYEFLPVNWHMLRRCFYKLQDS